MTRTRGLILAGGLASGVAAGVLLALHRERVIARRVDRLRGLAPVPRAAG